jgi:tetratricopeptide (TPR) repeat protein
MWRVSFTFQSATLSFYRDLGSKDKEAKSSSDLGVVRYKMGDFTAALIHHQRDLEICSELTGVNPGLSGVARALSHLGSTHEALGQTEDAIKFYERHLSVANQMDDPAAKTQSYENLGAYISAFRAPCT